MIYFYNSFNLSTDLTVEVIHADIPQLPNEGVETTVTAGEACLLLGREKIVEKFR